jgi:hypothetical protein
VDNLFTLVHGAPGKSSVGSPMTIGSYKSGANINAVLRRSMCTNVK